MTDPPRVLVVDGQVFQTPAWHRGMGKYSLQLLAAATAEAADLQVQLLLSAHLPSEPRMLASLATQLPRASVQQLDLRRDEPEGESVLPHNRRVLAGHLTALVAGTGRPVDLLVLSALQGLIQPAFPEVPGVRRIALVYDLIPLLLPDMYLATAEARKEYLPRLAELTRADLYLTISQTAADDLAGQLGIAPERIANLDGGAVEHSGTTEPVDVPTPFVLMPSGNDLRKNNRRAILGFERFNRARDNRYTLAVTSTFRPDEVATLSCLSPSVVFTGNVTGAQMAWLYEHAGALLFAPEYEGLGLPILEAMQVGCPVACSDISVFREISDDAFAFFDPRSIVGIAEALGGAVDGPRTTTASYEQVRARYSWRRVAGAFLAALALPAPAPGPRVEVTVVGPDPSGGDPAGIALADLHPELSRRHRTRYLLDPAGAVDVGSYLARLPDTAPLGPGASFAAGGDTVTLVHLANTRACARSLFLALSRPSVVVLHDTVLDEPWDELVASGLVSASRAELEDSIERQVRVPGTSHLAALLHGSRAIVVGTGTAQAAVVQVAALVRPEVALELIPPGVATLAYGQHLPESVAVMPHLDPATSTPLRLAEAAAHAESATFPAGTRLRDVLAVMRYAVRPVAADAAWGLPPEALESGVSARAYVERHHRIADSAEQLADLVRRVASSP